MKKQLIVALSVLIFSVAVMGCNKTEDIKTKVEETKIEDTEQEKETQAVVEDDSIPEGMYRSELTNELIDESLKEQRPIAAMVDNEKTALPHYGLSEADIVYEMMNSTKNKRITRLMVLVKDWAKIEQLGSIRSLRPTNILLAAEWNAVLCHDGGPFYNDPYLAEDYSDNFSGTFSRVNNGKAREFTEYILAGDLEKNFSNSKKVDSTYNEHYEGAHYQFATASNPIDFSDNESALDATEVKLPFEHNGSYLLYDEESKLYKYYEYGSAHLDPGNNNAQLSFKNLLIQSCTFSQYDENGYMIFNCIDSGKAGYYITNGKAIQVTWHKTSPTSPTQYFDADGKEITINTGKTYVALVPNDNWSELSIK
ncbi:MAG: DUF3048 domain-containing protein [Lachnospiraceae bacterium]